MNKHITIAAFLVAGTALANAATTDYWWDADTDASFGDKSHWVTEGVTVPDLGRDDVQLILGNHPGALIVDDTYNINALIFNSLYVVDTYNFSFTKANSTISANTINKWSSSKIGISLSAEAENVLKSAGEFVLFSSKNIFDGNNKINEMSLSSFSISVNSNTNVVLDTFVYSTLDAAREALALQSTRDYALVATSNKLSLVSLVPEPSAFGLLAGLGALALVAARRRRGRKA